MTTTEKPQSHIFDNPIAYHDERLKGLAPIWDHWTIEMVTESDGRYHTHGVVFVPRTPPESMKDLMEKYPEIVETTREVMKVHPSAFYVRGPRPYL